MQSTNTVFATFSCQDDVSGVTTWLERVIPALHHDRLRCALLLHHIASPLSVEYPKSSIYKSLSQISELCVHGASLSELRYTESEVSHTLQFLNYSRPRCFLPQCLPAFFYTAEIAGQRGLPWALTIHSDDPDYWGIANCCLPSRSNGVLVAVSEHIAREIEIRYPSEEVFVIPYGVPIPSTKAQWCGSKFRVVYSGRLIEKQKRISLVLETMISACRQSDLVEAVIIGDGPERPRLECEVQEAGLGDRIEFRGRISPLEVLSELSEAHALLLMSDYEGLPLSILEAMATGVVPVVHKIASGIPQLVKPNQTGVLVENSTELAALAIVELAKEPLTWNKLSKNARELVASEYSDDICATKWRSLIEELSQRSTVVYPLDIPKRIDLPSLPPGGLTWDRRRPTLGKQLLSWPFEAIRYARKLKNAFSDAGR